ncbi:SRPBCC family protein [Streptomyces incanus]|uniref:SRPBCC family protein n=1 Tax=Streptomyces incanus TaxID=887453 RepID=A0ABW0XZN1_9ACTN
MPTQHIHLAADTTAEPSVVYALLRDGTSWPTFSPLGSFELAEAGVDGAEGLGAVRIFRTRIGGRTYTSREKIVELVEDRRFSYVLLTGLAVRGYRADISLEPTGAGTHIRWHSTFDAKIPGTGWLYRRMITKTIAGIVTGLASAATTRANAADRRR